MKRMNPARLRAVVLFSAVCAVLASCTDGRSDSSAPPRVPVQCSTPLTTLLADRSGRQLTLAIGEHVPTEQELLYAGAIWALVLDAGASGAGKPAVLRANVLHFLDNIPGEYPSLFNCDAESNTAAQGLITSSKDFGCGKSCAPSASLFQKPVAHVVDMAVGKSLSALAKGTGLVEDAVDIASDMDDLATGSGDYADAIVDSAFAKDPKALAEGVGGALLGAAEIAGAISTAPAAKAVAAVLGAFQIGYELGTVANLVIECYQFKASYCCVAGTIEIQKCGASCCGGNEHCTDGICCPLGTVACSGSCVNGSTDNQHCGAAPATPCGVACSTGSSCEAGTCYPSTGDGGPDGAGGTGGMAGSGGADGGWAADGGTAGAPSGQDAGSLGEASPCSLACSGGNNCMTCGGVTKCVPNGSSCCVAPAAGGSQAWGPFLESAFCHPGTSCVETKLSGGPPTYACLDSSLTACGAQRAPWGVCSPTEVCTTCGPALNCIDSSTEKCLVCNSQYSFFHGDVPSAAICRTGPTGGECPSGHCFANGEVCVPCP